MTRIDANHIDRAFAVSAGASLTLVGVTVENGLPSASSSGSEPGGAIYNDGNLTVNADVFTGNQASAGPGGGLGGAIASEGDGSLDVTGSSSFTSNTAAAGGGRSTATPPAP